MSRPISAELLALLATRQFYSADLYTFRGGNLGNTVLTFCGGDVDVKANGTTYSAGGQIGPYFDRSDNKAKCHWKLGVEVDRLVIDIIPANFTMFGIPFAEICRRGVLDYAEMTLEKAFMPIWGDTSRGTVSYFTGLVGPIDVGRSILTMEIDSWLDILNLSLPKNLYQAPCGLNLGDQACGVDLENGLNGHGVSSGPFKTTGTVTSGSTGSVVNATLAGGPWPAGAFNLGKIKFTSGVLSGFSQTVKSVVYGSPANIMAMGYFPVAPGVGDTFTIYFGCDKTSALPFTTAATRSSGSPTLTSVFDTQGVLFGMVCTGTGIPAGTTVLNVAGNTILLSANASGSGSATYSFFSANGCFKFNNGDFFRGFKDVPQPALAF